jgi:hypothetical protein
VLPCAVEEMSEDAQAQVAICSSSGQSLYADRAGLRHLALRMLVTGAASLAVAQLSLSGEEAGGRFSKLLRKLEMRAMPGIREEDEPGVGEPLLQDE